MTKFLLRRLLLMVVILLAVSIVIFLITEILPGDAARIILGRQATPEALVALRDQLGLDRPALIRYFDWLFDVFRGDWGESLSLNVPVYPLVMERLSNSFVMIAVPFVLGVFIGIMLGVLAGVSAFTWKDSLIATVTLALVSLPEFVIASILIIIFAYRLDWFPATSMVTPGVEFSQTVSALVLPSLTLLAGVIAHITRMTRIGVIEVLNSDYIRTAYSKGLTQRAVLWRHVLQNAILPTIPVIAVTFGYLISGIVVVEEIFAYPGVGRLILRAVTLQDLPLLQILVMLMTAMYVIVNLLTDIAFYLFNPRIRHLATGSA